MPSPQASINFPIIEEINIEGYQIYPGNPDGSGLQYSFKSGVNIVVGVNGLGKTTFLNLLLRMLAGPIQISADSGLGMGRRATSPTNVRYFANRAMDRASVATAEAVISFAGKKIRAKRRLSDLKLMSLEIDGEPIRSATAENLEDFYKIEVLRLSGMQQFYDFVLMLQFVFFFLEDRQALIWDTDAQAEVLRILYYNPDSQTEYTRLYNEIAKSDSELRNTVAVVNRHKKRIEEAIKAKIPGGLSDDLKQVQGDMKKLNELIEQQEPEIEEFSRERILVRTSLEQTKVKREQLQTQLKSLNEKVLATMFSEAESRMLHSLASIIGDRGCTVCGSKSESSKVAVLEAINNHSCPLCNANDAVREYPQGSDSASDLSIFSEIRKLELSIAKYTKTEHDLKNRLTILDENHGNALKRSIETRANYDEMRVRERLLLSNLPKSDEDLSEIQNQLQGFQAALDSISKEKADNEVELLKIINDGEQIVSSVANGIIGRFDEYIKGFMAETCKLQYKVREEKIGGRPSDTKFRFPLFSVVMTSGVYISEGTVRIGSTDVSESQSEFIDLAFRMSVIAEISSRCPTMLVVETPEASLDSVFVPRAGRMINKFLSEHGDQSNRLIASTNLNKEAMIPALLDIISEQEAIEYKRLDDLNRFRTRCSEAVPSAERPTRIIDLLSIAAKNAALRSYESEYAQVYQDAVYPKWEKFESIEVSASDQSN